MSYNVSGDFRMDEQFVSIGKAAKMLGMSTEGLRKWDREGRLILVRTPPIFLTNRISALSKDHQIEAIRSCRAKSGLFPLSGTPGSR